MNGDPVRARAILDDIVVNVGGEALPMPPRTSSPLKSGGSGGAFSLERKKAKTAWFTNCRQRETQRDRERDAHTQSNHVHAWAHKHTTENGGKEQRSSRGSE